MSSTVPDCASAARGDRGAESSVSSSPVCCWVPATACTAASAAVSMLGCAARLLLLRQELTASQSRHRLLLRLLSTFCRGKRGWYAGPLASWAVMARSHALPSNARHHFSLASAVAAQEVDGHWLLLQLLPACTDALCHFSSSTRQDRACQLTACCVNLQIASQSFLKRQQAYTVLCCEYVDRPHR